MIRFTGVRIHQAFSSFLRCKKGVPASLLANDYLEPRHIGPTASDTKSMLTELKLSSMEDLISKVIPAHVRDRKALEKENYVVPDGISEHEFMSQFSNLMGKNKKYKCYIGNGYTRSITPAVIKRNVLENPNWYTPYTPYQAEIAQGRLEALLNFQTMVTELTGMDIANASLLDEGTACAEAMVMAHTINEESSTKTKFLIDTSTSSHIKEVVKTKGNFLNINIQDESVKNYDFKLHNDVFGVLIQNPNVFGVEDLTSLVKSLKEKGIVVVICADILSCAIVKSPGEMGADIVCGTTQRLGIPIGYGGPHAGFLSTKDEYKRKMPGRIIGVSKDRHGKLAYRMSLQTREQHIKREKATSNICTAQALLANMAGFYGVYHGPEVKTLKSGVEENRQSNSSIISKSRNSC